jgi:hypothetical protein
MAGPAQKNIPRRPPVLAGKAQCGGEPHVFSIRNSRKIEEKMQSFFVNQYRNMGQKHRKGVKNARKSFAA